MNGWSHSDVGYVVSAMHAPTVLHNSVQGVENLAFVVGESLEQRERSCTSLRRCMSWVTTG